MREQAEARRLREAGWSLRKIALALSISLSSASTWTRGVRQRCEQAVIPAGDPGSERIMECGKCHAQLPAAEFATSKRGAKYWCMPCYRAYFHARGEIHLRQTKAARTRRRARARRFVKGILSVSCCTDCGHDDALALEFDHVAGKRANVSLLIAEGFSLRRLNDEISLCEVVCVNCHRRRTLARVGKRRLHRQTVEVEPWPARRRNLLRLCDELDGAVCADCATGDRDVLEFDHRSEKRNNVINLACSEYSLEVLEAEIAKCDIRCANCHRRRTRLAQGAVPQTCGQPL